LKTLDIPQVVLPLDERKAIAAVQKAVGKAKKENRPVAIIVREGTFEKYSAKTAPDGTYPLTREAALHAMTPYIPEDAVVVSTTGKLSRELFEHRKVEKVGHHRDFLTVGSMGHASQIALGIALAQPKRPVYCFDGDGAAIMHLGGWAVIGQAAPKNLKHIVFNNGVHESVGGQPTAGFIANFKKLAEASGYHSAAVASTLKDLKASMRVLKKATGPALLEMRIAGGSRKDLGRPTRTPLENKKDLMKYLKKR
jgi:phosphonopyruvate decarboxylase